MAGKRSASSELNHDNWDQDEEPENAGTFQKASEESLKRRIIKTARRRNPISSVRDAEPEKKSAFSGFTGFSKANTEATTSFSFLKNLPKHVVPPKTNGTSDSLKNSKTTENVPASVSSASNTSIFTTSQPSIPKQDAKEKSDDYYSKLKGLNESVMNWITRHVEANPLINLQPIFKDYERYFKELDKDEDNKTEGKVEDSKDITKASSMSTFVFKTATNVPDNATEKQVQKPRSNKDTPKFSFGSFSVPTTSNDGIPKFGFSSTLTSNTFSFGNSISSSKSTVTPSLSFGGSKSSPNATSFSLTGSTPFTFNNVSQTTTDQSNKQNEEEKNEEGDDEPPKVEFTPVIEKDHIYTTRCKVFVKKDGNFGDRGVGNLYLKPIENSDKVQLIVRADTNLGNLLCNFILSDNIPTKRMGKKDVMLVCLPTPDFKPPPVPILLRVKSPEDADKLLEVLENNKK